MTYAIQTHAVGKKIVYEGKVRQVVAVGEDGTVTFADGEVVQQVARPDSTVDQSTVSHFCRSCGAYISDKYEYCYSCNRARYASHS